MNNRSCSRVLALALLAGLPAFALAQDRDGGAPASSVLARAAADYRTCDWITDRSVANDADKEIAEVSDLIIDRGSGRVQYLAVKTGSVLGLGGKTVAIPYGSFRWDAAKERYILASTTEELKQYPEFDADEWSEMMESKNDGKGLRDIFGREKDAGDPYADAIDSARTARIEGTVTRVERTQMGDFGEQVVITVSEKNGGTRRVALGPSWYIGGGGLGPARGDTVVIETLALPRDPDGLVVAREVRSGDRDLRLRDSDGAPTWSFKDMESSGKNYSTSHWRYMLASSLKGKEVNCRGEECGVVNEIIVDRAAGHVAFLSIDPNENFLGVADTKRLVPWAVVNVSLDGKAYIDAAKDMVLASPETPSEISMMPSVADRVYGAFQVEPPKLDRGKDRASASPQADDAWGRKGPIVGSMDKGTGKTLNGKVADVTTIRFGNGVESGKALKIDCNGREEIVLLGPTWYVDRQDLRCDTGDPVVVEVYRTTVDGQPYWVARSIDNKGHRIVLIDNTGPAWWRD